MAQSNAAARRTPARLLVQHMLQAHQTELLMRLLERALDEARAVVAVARHAEGHPTRLVRGQRRHLRAAENTWTPLRRRSRRRLPLPPRLHDHDVV